MKLRTETEHRIYAAAFIEWFADRRAHGIQACHREWAEQQGRDVVECWEATIAMHAVEEAESTVALYRKGLIERKRCR